jgi:hypothetical protein
MRIANAKHHNTKLPKFHQPTAEQSVYLPNNPTINTDHYPDCITSRKATTRPTTPRKPMTNLDIKLKSNFMESTIKRQNKTSKLSIKKITCLSPKQDHSIFASALMLNYTIDHSKPLTTSITKKHIFIATPPTETLVNDNTRSMDIVTPTSFNKRDIKLKTATNSPRLSQYLQCQPNISKPVTQNNTPRKNKCHSNHWIYKYIYSKIK